LCNCAISPTTTTKAPTQRRVPMAIEPRGAAVSEPDRQQLLRHAEFHSAHMRTICVAQLSGQCSRSRLL
jgi:hypothetical protein